MYIEVIGGNIWDYEPQGLTKAFRFKLNEISGDDTQKTRFVDALKRARFPFASSLEGADYLWDGNQKVTVKTKGGGETYIIQAEAENCFITTPDGQKELIGVLNPAAVNPDTNNPAPLDPQEKWMVYDSEAMMKAGYMKTDANGEVLLRWTPKGSIYRVFTSGSSDKTKNAAGEGHSKAETTFGIHVISMKSSLISGEFLLLVLIFVFALFSYRYFKDKRIDLYSWWRDYTGKK